MYHILHILLSDNIFQKDKNVFMSIIANFLKYSASLASLPERYSFGIDGENIISMGHSDSDAGSK